MRHLPNKALVVLAVLGCTPDPEPAIGESESETTQSETESETETETETETGDGDGDGDPCGNGVLDRGEACDDANTNEDDGCTSECTLGGCAHLWVVEFEQGADHGAVADLQIDADANVYAGGVTLVQPSRWLAKYDSTGEEKWSRAYPAEGLNTLVQVAVSPDNETLYAAGVIDEEAIGLGAWFGKFTANQGGKEWDAIVEDMMVDGDDFGTGIAVDSLGAPLFAATVAVSEGDTDVGFMKVQANNVPAFSETWSGLGNGVSSLDRAYQIAAGGDGTIFVGAGEFIDDGVEVATVIAVDTDGTVLWTAQPAGVGTGVQVVQDLAADSSGDAYVLTFAEQAPDQRDLYKLAGSTGAVLWSKPAAELPARMVGEHVDGDDVLVTGGSSPVGPWVGRWSSDGELLCASTAEVPRDYVVEAGGGGIGGGFALAGSTERFGVSWIAYFQGTAP